MNFERVCSLKSIKPNGEGVVGKLASGVEVVVFLHNGTLFATGNQCPHKDASMAEGDIEDIPICVPVGAHPDGSKLPGLCVRCPRHRKKFPGGLYFSLETGASFVKADSDHYKDRFHLPIYQVREEGGSVLVSSEPIPINDLQRVHVGASHKKDPWRYWQVSKIAIVNHDSRILSFTCDDPSLLSSRTDCDDIWHVALRLDETTVHRDYTPLSSLESFWEGRVEILVKVYLGGKLTPYLAALEVGETVQMRLPVATLKNEVLESQRNSQIVLIYGGTGVTPMLQILSHLIQLEQNQHVNITVLASNHTEEDILAHSQLNALCGQLSNVRVFHTLTQPELVVREPFLLGHVSRTMLEDCVQDPSTLSDALMVVCGPAGLCQLVKELAIFVQCKNFVELEA